MVEPKNPTCTAYQPAMTAARRIPMTLEPSLPKVCLASMDVDTPSLAPAAPIRPPYTLKITFPTMTASIASLKLIPNPMAAPVYRPDMHMQYPAATNAILQNPFFSFSGTLWVALSF